MNLLDLQSDPTAFRSALLIDTDGGPRPLGECIDPWQAEDFTALDSGWQRAAVGASAEANYQRGWLERPRGHAKTLDLAIMATWALFASRRRLSGIGAAGDQDQARLLRDAVGRLLYVNPWLSKLVEVQTYSATNTRTGSTLEIISSDAPTSYGLTPDFVIADEVVHWKKRDLWDSILSSAAKRGTCMFVVITNAGLSDDWQWTTREAVRADSSWYFSRLDGPVASWITPDRLAEQERLLPGIAYRRLWLNEWTSGGGDALTPEDIAAAFVPNLQPQSRAQPDFEYVAGVDAGVSRDASALCILGVRRRHDGHGTIRLAATRVWRPSKGRKVDLGEVETALVDAHARFNLRTINYDPWELRYLASRLQAGGLGRMTHAGDRRSGLPLVEVPPTGTNLQRMASALLEAFNDHRLELYDDADLSRDLTRFRVEERANGFRLVSPRDEHGHGDLGTAFSLAMLAASELAAKRVARVGAISDLTADRPLTALQRAMQRAYFEQDLFAREQEDFLAGEDHQAEFRELMRRAGRC